MKVYLAGKMGTEDWRSQIVKGLRDVLSSERDGEHFPHREPCLHYDPRPLTVAWPARLGAIGEGMYNDRDISWADALRWPVLAGAIPGNHDYVGPYYVCCEDAPWDWPGSHGLLATQAALDPDLLGRKGHDPGEPLQRVVCRLDLEAIASADLFFAWIDSPDCHGTIAELGYARGAGVWTAAAGPRMPPDLWFMCHMADRQYFDKSFQPVTALGRALAEVADTYLERLARRDYPAYLKTEHWQRLRRTALQAAGWRCQTCNTGDGLQVHHRTYQRLGREEVGDLTVLCDRCHGTFHGNHEHRRPNRR